MKIRKALFILTVSLTAGSSSYADKITLPSAPKAVQEAIRSRAGRTQIEDIDREVRANGQVTYEASWKVNGVQQELLVSEAGTILRDVIVGPSTGLANKNLTLANKTGVALTDAPQAVQNAINSQLLGAPVNTVEKGIWNGQTIYEVTYHRNGQLATYQVSETGQPIVGQVPAPGWQPKYSGLAQSNVPLSGGQKLPFTEAPKPVQNTVNQMSKGARVEDFERGLWNGRTVYEAAFKRDGQNVELQVLEDGTLLTHAPKAPVATASAGQNTPAPSQRVQPVHTTPYGVANVPRRDAHRLRYAGLSEQNVPLSGGQKIPLTQAPANVQRTVKQATEGAQVEDFERGVWNGRTVYEAAFKRNGQNMEVQVLEDGSILTKEAATAAGAPISGGVQP